MLNIASADLQFHSSIAYYPKIAADPSRLEIRREQSKRMHKIMHDYCAKYDARAKKSDEKRFEALLRVLWSDLMADYQYALDPITLARNNCDVQCFKHKTLMCISHELEMYGCWLHGTVHRCEAKTDTCRSVFITNDMQEICIFSGRSLGVALVQHADSTYKQGYGSSGLDRRKYAMSREDIENKRNSFSIRPNLLPAQQQQQKAHSIEDALAYEQQVYEKRSVQAKLDSVLVQRAPPRQKSPAKKRARAAVSEQRADQFNRQAAARAHVVIESTFHDFLDNEGRKLYNAYVESEHKWLLSKSLDDYLKSVQRERTLPNTMRMLTLVANVNNSLELLLVDNERPAQIIGRYRQIIKTLWRACFESPYAKSQIEIARNSPAQERRQRTPSSPASFTPTPSNTGLCTLQQFSLAILYSLREGFYLKDVDSSCVAAGSGVTVFAANEKLASLLPPRAKVHYFGATSRSTLRQRIANAYFGPAKFDPLENLHKSQEAGDALESSRQTLRAITKSGARNNHGMISENTDTSLSLSISNQSAQLAPQKSSNIAASLINSQRSAIRHKSRKRRRAIDDNPLVEGERQTKNFALSNGGGGGGGGGSACVAVYLREPFLTNNALVYSEHCIEEGLRMLQMSLKSYGAQLHSVLQEYK